MRSDHLSPLLLLCCILSTGHMACGYLCDRDDSADGTYAVVSDCSGILKQGTLLVGASSKIEIQLNLQDLDDICPTTIVAGTEELGLPSETVTVEGERHFSLSGVVHGQRLTCDSENFGSENILFCRIPGGELYCVAFVERFGAD